MLFDVMEVFMAIASMILGIVSIVFSESIGLVPAILAIVFAKKAESAEGPSGYSNAGKICGIIGLILSVIFALIIIGYIIILVGGTFFVLMAESL